MYTPRDRIESPNYQEWLVFSRLPAGISLQRVRANLQAIEPQVQKAADPSSNIFAIEGKPLLSAQSGEAGSTNVVQMVRVGLLAMEALALTLYMVCCCNLFLLFKSRARQELHANAIRIALGAKRIESYRLILWESLLLSFVGSVLIVPIGWISGHVISHIVEAVPGFESFSSVSPHPLSVVEVAAMSLITTIMCGLTAQFFTKGNKFASLSGGSRIVSKKSSAWIIGIEVVASLVLTTLTCVELLGFERNLHRDSGFASSAVVATLDLNGLGSGKVTQIIDKLQTLPGISSVATMNIAPLSGATSSNELLARRAGGAVIHKRGIWEADVSPRYFTTIGTFIVKGRGFLNGDSGGDPVCVLSRAAAATFFGGGNPIDRHIYGYDPRQPMDISHNYCRIIGVAVNAHLQSMGDDPVPTVYTLSKENGPVIIVRGENSRIASDAVRTAVMAVAPTVLTDGISSIHDLIGSSLHVNKILVLFAGICTAITAAILSVGVFGILAIQVSERRREIAIRIALGADKSAVRLSILKGLRVPILIGIFLGSLISVPSAMALANSFSLSLAVVMCIYLASVFVLLGIVFAAAAIPTWRALAVPPTECLLAE
jgi:hypothetical protein